MQRDFLEPGGFGETLGNDVSQLAPDDRAVQGAARRPRAAGDADRAHARRPSPRPRRTRRRPRSSAARQPAHRRPGPMGRILVRGEPGHDIIPELYPQPGEPVIDKPGKGAFFATDLHAILQNRGIENLIVVRRDDRGVRAHDGARGERPRLPLPRAGRLLRLLLPGVPRSGPADDQGAGRHLRLGVATPKSVAAALGSNAGFNTTRRENDHERRRGIQAQTLGAGRLERLLRLRHQHPRQPAGAHGAAALRAEDAGRHRLRPHPARDRADAVPEHGVLRVARLPARAADRPHRRLRAALRDQRAAHVRRHVRDHAADLVEDRRSDQGLGGGADLGVHSELRADGRRASSRRASAGSRRARRCSARSPASRSRSSRCGRRWRCS